MKRVDWYEINEHTAFNRNMFCPHCGNHMYQVWKNLKTGYKFIKCEFCGYEGPSRITKRYAKKAWKNDDME